MLAGLKARIRLGLIQAPRNRRAKRMKQKEAAISFMQMVAEGKVREAYDGLISPDFRHHNQFFKGDRRSLMLAMEENAQKHPNRRWKSKRFSRMPIQ